MIERRILIKEWLLVEKRIYIKNYTKEELEKILTEEGLPRFRANQIIKKFMPIVRAILKNGYFT